MGLGLNGLVGRKLEHQRKEKMESGFGLRSAIVLSGLQANNLGNPSGSYCKGLRIKLKGSDLGVYEPLSKLLVSPLINPIISPYIFPI